MTPESTPLPERLLRHRSPALSALGVGAAMAFTSLAICLGVYWLLDFWPEDLPSAIVMLGLPVLLPLVVGSRVIFRLLRLSAALHRRTSELESEIRRRIAAEQRLQRLANHDDLTGLANRRAFFTHATNVAASGERSCVAVIDLDHFKTVNDTHGHAAGDGVLREFATVLQEHACDGAFMGRLGGEEFGVIIPISACPDILGEMDRLRSDAHDGISPRITTSIGVTEWEPSSGETIDAALARADIGLYRAKQRGRNRVEFVPRAADVGARGSSDLSPVARRS